MEPSAQDLAAQLAALPDDDSRERVDLLNAFAREFFMQDPPRARESSEDALAIARRLDYEKGVAYSLYHIGFSDYLRSDHAQAMTTLLEAERLMKSLADEHGLGLVLGAMSGVHLSLGDYERALASSFAALKRHRQAGDRTNEGWLLHGIGSGYHEMGDFTRALQFHRDALKVFEEIGLDVGRGRALNGMGTVHQSRQEWEQALVFHRRSLEIFQKADNDLSVARARNDIGVILQAMGEFRQAREHHEQALKLREKFGNKQAMSTSLINLGKLLLAEGEAEQALAHVQRALNIAEEIEAKPRIFQSHLVLSDIRSVLGEPRAALEHYKTYERMKEQVSGDLAASRLVNLQVGFEMEKAEQEAEISRLKNVELKEKNTQLEALLDELHSAQAQVIQSEKMAALGSLVAGLLHEFNTPLGAITGTSDVTNRCVERIRRIVAENHVEMLENKKFVQALGILERNHEVTREATGRISQITRSLTGFTRLDDGDIAQADANEGINHTLTLLEHDFRNRVAVVRNLGPVPLVRAQSRELNQVFMTLLKNAGEAILERGTVSVATDLEADRVHIEISDTGTGMDAALLARIFEPSFSGKGQRVKAGLGLVAAASIVRKNDGEISAESRPGSGTVFHVWLPIIAASASS